MIRRVWPLVLAVVGLGMNAYVIAGVLPAIAHGLGTSGGVVGLGVSAFTAAYAIGGPLLSGPVATRWPKGALVGSLLVFIAGNVASASAPTAAIFLTGRGLTGVGAGILTPIASGMAAASVPSVRRGSAMAAVTFGLAIGTVAGVPVGMMLGSALGWRVTIWLIVAISTISLAALAITLRTLTPAPPAGGLSGVVAPLRSRPVLVGLLVSFLLGVVSLGAYTYLLPMATTRGLGDWGLALIWAWGIGGVAGSMLAGRALAGRSARRILRGIILALALAFAVLALTSVPGVWVAATACWGAAGWASVPALQRSLTELAPETQTVPLIATQMATMYLGSSAGAALGGPAATAPTLIFTAATCLTLVALATTTGIHPSIIEQLRVQTDSRQSKPICPCHHSADNNQDS